MSATYDPTTTAGRVRLLIADTNVVTPTFSDEEIAAFLALESDDVWLSAAAALTALASDKARLSAYSERIGGYSYSKGDASKALLEAAQAFRDRAMQEPAAGAAELNLTIFSGLDIQERRDIE